MPRRRQGLITRGAARAAGLETYRRGREQSLGCTFARGHLTRAAPSLFTPLYLRRGSFLSHPFSFRRREGGSDGGSRPPGEGGAAGKEEGDLPPEGQARDRAREVHSYGGKLSMPHRESTETRIVKYGEIYQSADVYVRETFEHQWGETY